uniref:Uncharacterized protein n=1 Tax=Arundo donax TaxID=35708 RepID=A0A0A8ZBR6_ARUDO
MMANIHLNLRTSFVVSFNISVWELLVCVYICFMPY